MLKPRIYLAGCFANDSFSFMRTGSIDSLTRVPIRLIIESKNQFCSFLHLAHLLDPQNGPAQVQVTPDVT